MKRRTLVFGTMAWITITLATITATPANAQESAAEPGSWRVLPLPHVDLWYHGLAVTGFDGSGPDPLYDPSYRARVREVKEGLEDDGTSQDRGQHQKAEDGSGLHGYELPRELTCWIVQERELIVRQSSRRMPARSRS